LTTSRKAPLDTFPTYPHLLAKLLWTPLLCKGGDRGKNFHPYPSMLHRATREFQVKLYSLLNLLKLGYSMGVTSGKRITPFFIEHKRPYLLALTYPSNPLPPLFFLCANGGG
jgi:hypothetical protein